MNKPSITSNQQYASSIQGRESSNISWAGKTGVNKISSVPFIAIGILLSAAAVIGLNYLTASPVLIIFVGILGLVVLSVIIQKPEVGSYLLIITVFTNMSDLFTEKGLPSINKPLVGILVLSILAHFILRTGKLSPAPKFTRAEYSLIVYCIVVMISFYIAVNPVRASAYILDLVKDVAILFCILITLNTKEKWITGASALILAITIVSLLGVIHTLTGSNETFFGLAQQSAFGQTDDSGELRFGGPIAESNIWGQVLVSIIPFVIYRFFNAKTIVGKSVFAMSTILILLSMLFTQSRGAMLALAIILLLIIIEMRISGQALATMAAVGLIILFLVPTKYTDRIWSLSSLFQTNQEYSYAQDGSIEGRREKMLTGLAMFGDNPILGVGFANYTDNYWEYAGNLGLESSARNLTEESSARQPHSLYIEIMAETGLLGLMTFIGFFGFMLQGLAKSRRVYKNRGSMHDADWSAWITSAGMSVLTFLIAGFFLHGIGFRFIWVLAGMVLSLIHVSNLDTTNKLALLKKTK